MMAWVRWGRAPSLPPSWPPSARGLTPGSPPASRSRTAPGRRPQWTVVAAPRLARPPSGSGPGGGGGQQEQADGQAGQGRTAGDQPTVGPGGPQQPTRAEQDRRPAELLADQIDRRDHIGAAEVRTAGGGLPPGPVDGGPQRRSVNGRADRPRDTGG